MISHAKWLGLVFVMIITAVSVHHLMSGSGKFRVQISEKMPSSPDVVDGPIMMELYSPYCPSCSQMAPLVESLAKSCEAEGVSVVQYDISAAENEYLVDELSIEAVPTFVFIDESGRETERLVGKQTADALHSGLAGIGGRACDGRS